MSKKVNLKSFTATLCLLLLIMGILFAKSCQPEQVLFSSDGPLGAISSAAADMKTGFQGYWQDLNWIGIEGPIALPNTSSLVSLLLGTNPVLFSKFNAPLSLIILGLSIWILLRQLGMNFLVCTIAAIAAALNMNSFSHACWGLPSRAWTQASTFLALAALVSSRNGHPFLKCLLAGLAVSNAIMEGFDVGAIYSLYVAAFAFFIVFATQTANLEKKILPAVARVAIVALFAALCSAAALNTLIGTQIQGIAGMEQDTQTKEQRWDAATMWSLPKTETLRVLIPGLFGYRMDTENGGNYWGEVGQVPGDPRTRHSGAGEYAGALVLLIAAYGIASAFRKKDCPYTPLERKIVLFFSISALISLLLAWGRHAPFYHLVYALPYFSTIRNPIKFMHPFQMSLLILFGFGLNTLYRTYVLPSEGVSTSLPASFKQWWVSAKDFNKKFSIGTLVFFVLSALATLIYLSSRRELISHLVTAGFGPTLGDSIAAFSYKEVGLELLMLGASVFLLFLTLSSRFYKRQWVFFALYGLLISVDLMRANIPWIQYYDYKTRYAMNPIFNFLRDHAYEHRVTAKVVPFGGQYFVTSETAEFAQAANVWLQHQFQFYNIQSLEPVQMPRPPILDEQFFRALLPVASKPPSVIARMWQLTNTRYLLGDKRVITEGIFPQIGLTNGAYRIVMSFDMSLKPGIQPDRATLDDIDWVIRPDGRFGIVEYSGALPRASLYPRWEYVTNDQQALATLSSPQFDPHSRVLVHEGGDLSPSTNVNISGNISITRYAPKHIELAVSNNANALLLYNDKYSPSWKVKVDNSATKLVRANFIMRGLFLPAGNHTIVMSYEPPNGALWVSLVGIAIGLLILLYLSFSPVKRDRSVEAA
jgi:hypothetical protein